MTAITRRSHTERERWAEELLDRLTPAMSALGILFLLVVLGEQLARKSSALSTVMTVAGWLLWAVFVVEFVARLVVAPDTGQFLRTGRVLSSAVRSSRSAKSVLGGRVGWLSAVSAITVLGGSQLLYEFGDYVRYGDALHAAALATITGEPLARQDSFAKVLEVVLAAFSVVVFATLAGSLGAYFLESRRPEPEGRQDQ